MKKKDALKKNLKLQIHRETLRALEETQLPGIGAGISGATCIPCTTYTKYC